MVRTCVGCRRALPATGLVRVRSVDGRLETGSGPGRGAWVGPAVACIERAARGQVLGRALRAEVNGAEIARLVTSWSTELLSCPHVDD